MRLSVSNMHWNTLKGVKSAMTQCKVHLLEFHLIEFHLWGWNLPRMESLSLKTKNNGSLLQHL